MNNTMASKKGFALIVAMILVIILFISIAVHSKSINVYREVEQDEIKYNRGYFAALAALRYAAILLKQPGDLTFTAGVYTVTGNELVGNNTDTNGKFFTEMGVTKFPVYIKEITTGVDAGKYEISAAFPVK